MGEDFSIFSIITLLDSEHRILFWSYQNLYYSDLRRIVIVVGNGNAMDQINLSVWMTSYYKSAELDHM